ncbi:hypothetical protein VRRI112168_14855 [Vreelandella rituensis]|uniref:Phosphoadenosine phosphosulphate reductase domain-containing protein n=1 Tax=Vreelandella rituensis TaxID=2282306 RepID=A0A368U9A6_9GAMM|nr:hypothetical protein [Halomonas rituensis]RCV93798.1 hypothetical protein DU506_01175 [Halomonas rituensis]
MNKPLLPGQTAFIFDPDQRRIEAVDLIDPLPEACQPDAPFEDKVALALESLVRHMAEGYHLITGTSYGKDSSVTNALVCAAMHRAIEQGIKVPHAIFAHAEVGYDNPVMEQYALGEANALKAYIEKHNLPASVEVQSPSLSNDYMVNMVGGRMTATMPGQGRACADMLKVQTNKQLKRRCKSLLPGKTINVVGKRWSESASRAQNMAASGERPDQFVTNRDGERLLCPIAHFTLDDVGEHIGMTKMARQSSDVAAFAAYATYSDFEALTQVYRDGNGGECMITAFANGKASSAGCGQRFGCWSCSQIENDRSMENMVAESHPHLKPLLDIRQAIVDNHWDPDKRSWLTREPNEFGELEIGPNAYSPEFCRELLRFIITAQANEEERAAQEGTVPAFQVFDERKVMAIQALWSRYGYHEPWAALSDWHAIYNGKRYYPEARDEPALRQDFPSIAAKDRARFPLTVFTGKDAPALQSIAWSFAGDCVPWEGDGPDPRLETQVPLNSGPLFDVDAEGAELFVWIMGPDVLKKARDLDPLMALKQTEPDVYQRFAEANPGLLRDIRNQQGYPPGTHHADVVRQMLSVGFLSIRKGDRDDWERKLTVADSLAWGEVSQIMDNPKALQYLGYSISRYGGDIAPHIDKAAAIRLSDQAKALKGDPARPDQGVSRFARQSGLDL